MPNEREGGLLVVALHDDPDDLRIIRYVKDIEEARSVASEKFGVEGIRAIYVLPVEMAVIKP